MRPAPDGPESQTRRLIFFPLSENASILRDPSKAAFQDFEPFWEFVSGPLHAGTYGPNALDMTFGPQLVYIKAPSEEQSQNLPPSEGMQFFGHVAIDGYTQQMTVTLKDVDDRSLWAKTLDPKLG